MGFSTVVLLLLEIGNGNDPAMTIDNLASVHLQQDREVNPLAADKLLQEISSLWTTRLLQFGRVNESEPDCNSHLALRPPNGNPGQKSIAVEHPKYGHPKSVGSGIFGCVKQASPPF